MDSKVCGEMEVSGEKLGSNDQYHFLGDENDSNLGLLGNNSIKIRKNRDSKCQAILILTGLAVFLPALCVAIYLSVAAHAIQNSIHLYPTGMELGDCGSNHTPEEARAKGCLFDAMSWLWVRPECYDQALIDNFMNRTDWSWHTDWRLTPESQVPLETVLRGDHPHLFTQKKYHSIHCTYMWQKMHKALLEHTPVGRVRIRRWPLVPLIPDPWNRANVRVTLNSLSYGVHTVLWRRKMVRPLIKQDSRDKLTQMNLVFSHLFLC
jgi:hypothetical protein